MTRNEKKRLANRMLKLARILVEDDNKSRRADEGDEEEVDPVFVQVVRNVKSQLPKLTSKRNKKLRSFGIDIIRGNDTVEDLVAALSKVVGA